MGMTAQRQDSIFYEIIIFMYSIIICYLNDCTIPGMAGVGAESISALVSFLADIDRRGRIWNPPLHLFSIAVRPDLGCG